MVIEEVTGLEAELYLKLREDFLAYLRIRPSRISSYVFSERFRRFNREQNGIGLGYLGSVIDDLLDESKVEFKDDFYVLRS